MRDTSESHESESHESECHEAASCGSGPRESECRGSSGEPRITLRGPAELADALPYLMGFHPTDSAVLVALHGESGRFGGRVRVGLPASPQEWSDIAAQLADCLVTGSERRGPRPDGIVVFLCQDPSADGTGREVMERLRPLAQRLRVACGSLDVPVLEALCISDGRYWSYCCPDSRCCPPEGNVLALPGTSVMAAAATYAGIQVRGSLREMEERLTPWRTDEAADQERALDAAAAEMFPRILSEGDRRTVADETLDLAARLMRRIAEGPGPDRGTDAYPVGSRGAGTLLLGRNASDDLDDGLIAHDEAAAVILGLQDRMTRDWAAEWMEGVEAGHALRLWRALARRCVGPYGDHAAALLTLAGWVSWSTGDDPNARVAFSLALRADPDYRFAQLLHQACNGGLDPEKLRICLREERAARLAGDAAAVAMDADARPAGGAGEPPEPTAVKHVLAPVAGGAAEAETAVNDAIFPAPEDVEKPADPPARRAIRPTPEDVEKPADQPARRAIRPTPEDVEKPADQPARRAIRPTPEDVEKPADQPARRAIRPKPRRKPTPSSRNSPNSTKSPNSRSQSGSSASSAPAGPKSGKVRDRARYRGGERVHREG